MSEKYIYAVARIRANEFSLLSENDISTLMSYKEYEDCINFLINKGWGKKKAELNDYSSLLKEEKTKVWQFISELVSDRTVFNVIFFPIDYHNLKAAIKGHIAGTLSSELFLPGGTISCEYLVKCIKENNITKLPLNMANSAKLAVEKLIHNGDGQICDNIIDKALLEAIKAEGKNSKSKLIKQYSDFFVASTNLKIAIRSKILGKNREFLKSMLVECSSLNVEKLIDVISKKEEHLFDYLKFTKFADAIPFIKKSLQMFEYWCENKVIEIINSEKYDYFSVDPIIAYVLAKEYEIKIVRIILSAKLNHIDDKLIKERIRAVYA